MEICLTRDAESVMKMLSGWFAKRIPHSKIDDCVGEVLKRLVEAEARTGEGRPVCAVGGCGKSRLNLSYVLKTATSIWADVWRNKHDQHTVSLETYTEETGFEPATRPYEYSDPKQVLSELTPGQRRAATLKYRGFSMHEIGQHEGKTADAVKHLLARARTRIEISEQELATV